MELAVPKRQALVADGHLHALEHRRGLLAALRVERRRAARSTLDPRRHAQPVSEGLQLLRRGRFRCGCCHRPGWRGPSSAAIAGVPVSA
jgi:hypothetical protein